MAYLFKRGKVWYVYWYSQGITKARSTGTSNKQVAEKIRRKIEDQLALNKFSIEQIDNSKLLSSFSIEALKYSATNKSIRTYELDKLALDSFNQFSGKPPIREISPKLIEEYKIHLLESRKPTTVNIYLRHLSSIFSLALKYQYIQSNPFKLINLLPTPDKLPVFLTKTEAKTLLSNLSDNLLTAVMIALYTGARISEICVLEWKDIKDDIIYLYGKGNKQRPVPMPDILIKYLYRESRIENRKFILTMRNYKELTRQFRKQADKCGFGLKFHNLRDTYASWLAQSGVAIQVIQKLLGHQSIKTTMIYAHLSPDNFKNIVQNLE